MSKVWFITGCSTGFGKLLARELLEQGHRVAATARDTSALEDLHDPTGDMLLTASLDVTRGGRIESAVSAAIAKFGHIDVLVNNAGYGYFATQEEGDVDEFRRVLETNVVGLWRITRQVLPQMRERGSGVIVNLSSVAGRVTFPRAGFYNASKWAVEALSEALHYEVESFGIRVVVIEPGAYATDFATRSAVRSEKLGAPDSPYADASERWTDALGALMPTRQDPMEVVEGIIAAASDGESFVRIPYGEDAVMMIGEREEQPVESVRKMSRRLSGR